jgi:hypothetical protein
MVLADLLRIGARVPLRVLIVLVLDLYLVTDLALVTDLELYLDQVTVTVAMEETVTSMVTIPETEHLLDLLIHLALALAQALALAGGRLPPLLRLPQVPVALQAGAPLLPLPDSVTRPVPMSLPKSVC